MTWYQISIAEVLEKRNTSRSGLNSEDGVRMPTLAGPNEIQESRKKSITKIFLSQFSDLMILILLASAIISGIIGDLTDTIVILIIVVLNALLGFFQEYRAEKAMQALQTDHKWYTLYQRRSSCWVRVSGGRGTFGHVSGLHPIGCDPHHAEFR